MAEIFDSCQDGRHMKNRLCYAWFGDEDVKQVFASLGDKIPTDGAGEAARNASPGHDSHRREVRPEPPRTQPLFKTP